ncbi:alpha-amylase family protein [Pseudomonas sp. BAY1663]|nr:alpha-amylase family protein [Pseudomonas sp. BAY1663]
MVVQHYLDSQGDAWEWTLNTLDRAVRDELAGGVSLHENQFSALDELEAFNRLLGQRLGEMHMLLASDTDDPAFRRESTDKKQTTEWAASVAEQLDQALQRLAEHRGDLERKDAAALGQLLERRTELLAQVKRLAARTQGGLRTRVHGDLHLGQVLVVQGDAYFIDFEGEPSRPLDQRRAKHSPFKDVSGLLRSFEYAAAMTIRGAQVSDSSAEADQARQNIAANYQRSAHGVFLQAYREATAELPHAWRDEHGANAAMLLFSLEKCAYEIVYEAENRPAWLVVPLQGLLSLTQQLFDGGSND